MEKPEVTQGDSGQKIHLLDGKRDVSTIPWKHHERFQGVYLKNLISGSETGGLFSSHMVRIDPGCRLDTHCHHDHSELHEIQDGEGHGQLDQDGFDCSSGDMTLIPKGTPHSLQAGSSGMIIYAKFFPAFT